MSRKTPKPVDFRFFEYSKRPFPRPYFIAKGAFWQRKAVGGWFWYLLDLVLLSALGVTRMRRTLTHKGKEEVRLVNHLGKLIFMTKQMYNDYEMEQLNHD